MSEGLNGGRDESRIAPCRWCDDKYTPAGIEHHQRWCDENPHPGVSYEMQVEHGIPPVGGDGDDAPDLPPVETLSADAD